jgi:hypothetical protein
VSAAENLSAQVPFQGRNALRKLRKKHFAMAVFPQHHFFGMNMNVVSFRLTEREIHSKFHRLK